jgi:hypothetical protein
VEDCRHLSRRLEADLLAAGERIVRVPPKLMAHARDAARTYGKSDPIDALAVARAALREPGLPTARLDGPERELRLLADHREDLVAERTRAINRLRWHLHELDPGWDPKPRSLTRRKNLAAVAARLAGLDGMAARIAADLAARITALTIEASALEKEITGRVRQLAPSLLALRGVAELTAAKIVAETAGVDRFRSKDAYVRHNGTPRCRYGPATGSGTGWRAPATGSSTVRSCLDRPSRREDLSPVPARLKRVQIARFRDMPVPPHDDAVAGQAAAPLQLHSGDLAGGHADPEAVVTLAERGAHRAAPCRPSALSSPLATLAPP